MKKFFAMMCLAAFTLSAAYAEPPATDKQEPAKTEKHKKDKSHKKTTETKPTDPKPQTK